MIAIVAFFAGVLTVLAPCVLPLLPIIIGGNASASSKETKRDTLRRTFLIVASLAVSVFVFSLLLKGTTTLIGVPDAFWRWISGGIVILLGIHFLYPNLWLNLMLKTGLGLKSQQVLAGTNRSAKPTSSILTGAALGPVFTSCSPAYALILAVVLPSSWVLGSLYLLAYVAGMSLTIGLVAYYGARLTRKMGWAMNEHGVFAKVIGVVFIVVGVFVLTGGDKALQAWLLENGAYDGASGLENLIKL